jgi:hypothetical protein
VVLLDGRFFCRHCGASYTMNLPAPINVAAAAMNAFVDDHEKCKLATPNVPGTQLDLLKDGK